MFDADQKAQCKLFMNELRSATDELHQQLDSSPAAVQLMSEAVTIDDYRRYLENFFPIVSAYETQVFPLVADVLDDLDERKKADTLRDELERLGSTCIDSSGFQLPSISTPMAMGYMYVIEGSTLGGAMMYKHLLKQGIITEHNSSFFAVYGEATGRRWKQFLETLCSYVQQRGEAAAVIAGARQAFQRIYQHMVQQ